MSLEYPPKIAEKDICLHKNTKTDGWLSYLVIFCLDAVVRVSEPTPVLGKLQNIFSVHSQNTLYCFLQSQNIMPSCSITSQNAVYVI